MKNPLKSGFNSLFSPKEASFILWFVIFFLGSASVLALFGLLPSELTEKSDGLTLSEKLAETATNAVVGNSATNNGNGANNGEDVWVTGNGITGQNGQSGQISNGNSVAGSNNGANLLTKIGLPSRLVIPSIQVDTEVVIPRNTSVEVLDNDLTKGPVYYPGSGTINSGNMFIFGHSTGYKVVINKAYKVFNDLKTLSKGDLVYIESEGKKFSYKVRSVDKVDKDETLVTFDTKAHLLTLSTCNSFGSKSDRYVVVAEFAGEI
ncbi:MAG: sortase [Candidatus Pacebacteria bacterium]|nr:sortase [Candidatus Paceibacterota bacterium]